MSTTFRSAVGLEVVNEMTDEVDGTSDSYYKVPLFTEIMEFAREFSIAHQILASLMVNKGIVTKKQFYINFLRSVVTLKLKRHQNVVSRIVCSVEDLERLVVLLSKQLNDHLSALGLRLTSMSDERSGHELMVLTSDDVFGKDAGIFTGFTVDEMTLFSLYLREFVERNGICGNLWAINEVSKLSNRMTLMKAQYFIDKLVRNGWISKKDEEVTLEPRAIAELEPVLVKEYGCPRCVLCQKVVIWKNLAVLCDSCDVYIHRHCWLKFAASSEADEISCPAKTWRECENVFSKSEVARLLSDQSP